ncbi:uncharacterized protein with GYD domain [Methylobacterium sp. BE186]|uniref:hypothetical protein n=1 Tax=Methylobacterium sp. BE186 TaxID=2817715 RepID=UPI0028591116|nr:hypothetical protein [Methylobacterium sp. BE186]MDR7036666.1 uncharacterized protein with GYD domain [Methylobacterium sp. BE186]
MTTRRSVWQFLTGLPLLGTLAPGARAADGPAAPAEESPTGPPGTTMLTVFLRHDQTKTVSQINEHLKHTGWFRDFPPAGVEVVSWYVMMGIGQVVTLRFAPERLREVNILIERAAWGGFRTEFYPTYDYRKLYQDLKAKMG